MKTLSKKHRQKKTTRLPSAKKYSKAVLKAAHEINLFEMSEQLSQIGSWEHNLKTNAITWSDEMYRLYGLKKNRQKLTYQDFLNRVHPDDRQRISESPYHYEVNKGLIVFRIIKTDGEERVIAGRFQILTDKQGRPKKAFGSNQDVTHEYLLRTQLSEAQELSNLGSWEWHAKNQQTSFSSQAIKILNLHNQQNLTFDLFLKLVHPEDRAVVKDKFKTLLRGQAAVDVYHRLITPTGDTRYLHSRAKALKNSKGELLRVLGTIQDVTATNLMRTRYEETQMVTHAGSWEWDIETDKIYWSDELYRIYGRDRETTHLNYEGFLSWFHPDDREKTKKIVEDSYRARTPFSYIHRIIRPDGSMRWMRGTGEVLTDSNGQPKRMRGTAQDVTDLRETETALLKSEARFRRLLESNIVGICVGRLDCSIIEANDSFLNLFGFSRPELIRGEVNWVKLAGWNPKKNLLSELEQKKALSIVETTAFNKDGTPLTLLVSLALLDEGNDTYIGVVIDVTTTKRLEDALKKSESRFLSLINSDMLGIRIIDLDGRVLESNDTFLKMIGYTRADLNDGKINWSQLTPTEYHHLDKAKADLIRRTGSVKPWEKEYIRKDGTRVPILVGAASLEENSEMCISLVLDISDRKHLENELRASESRIRGITSSISDFLWSVEMYKNGEFREVYLSPVVERITGRKPEELRSLDGWLAIVHPDDKAFVKRHIEELVNGEKTVSNVEYRIVYTDGQTKWIRASSRVKPIPNGSRLDGVISDITEKKLIEKQLEQKNLELERSNIELEQFAMVASHDLKEPLRSIMGFSRLLNERYKDRLDESAAQYLKYLLKSAARMENLISNLLGYAKVNTDNLTLAKVDCNLILENVLSNLKECIKEQGAIITSDKLPTLRADPVQMEQLFQNLISNAIKFRGKARPNIRVRAQKAGTSYRFSVQDNGIGIQKENAKEVFKAFQRGGKTKDYPGVGIGLATCKKILERHGGDIWVDSKVGKGSVFNFTIPNR